MSDDEKADYAAKRQTSPSPSVPYSKIRVLIVDDHAVVRQGLRTFIDLQADMMVVAEAENGREAIELASRLRPDVVLLDLVMPEMDGVEATAGIVAISPGSRVLILTSFGDDDKVFPSIRAGAQGYLLKDVSPDQLVQAVRDAHRGKAPLDSGIAGKLMAAVAAIPSSTAEPSAAGASVEELSEREREVLRLIARGLSNSEIAGRLIISEKTVKTHVSSILGKLGLDDRTQAAIWALKHSLGDH